MNIKQKKEHYQNKAFVYRDRFRELQDVNLRLKKELANIAAGLISSKCQATWDNETKTRYTAAQALVEVKTVEIDTSDLYI